MASNQQPPRLQRGALPPELGGHRVDLAGFEPAHGRVPASRTRCLRAPNAPGCRLPRTRTARRIVDAGLLMPSAVELPTADPAGHSRGKHGRQESNPQRTALETAALPVELHPHVQLSMPRNRNAARSRYGRAASARRLRALLAPPPQPAKLLIDRQGVGGLEWQARPTAARLEPLRFG